MSDTFVLETQRCVLSPLKKDDFSDLETLYSSQKAREFLGGPIVSDAFQQKFEGMLQAQTLQWVARDKIDDSFIGLLFVDKHHNGDDWEISYLLNPVCWGKGLGTELYSCIMRFCSAELKLEKIVSETQERNTASCHLLEKCGLKRQEFLVRFGERQVLYAYNFKQ